jgi:intein/homing endonuclease
MLTLQTNDISEKQLAQIALAIQNRWEVPAFVKMHEVAVIDDDLDRPAALELQKDFENGLSIIFENLDLTLAFRLKRRARSKYVIERIPGSALPDWMTEIEKPPIVPEEVFVCPHCVMPETLILGDNKAIVDYRNGDAAMGRTGLNTVHQTFARPFSGKIVTIRANGLLPITTTSEHPILISSSTTSSGRKSGKNFRQVEFSKENWIAADKLVPKSTDKDGDYVSIPIIKGNFADDLISLSSFIVRHLPRHKGYRSQFPLTVDTAWFLGMFVAEGSITSKEVRFSLDKNEQKIRAELVRIASNLGYSSFTKYFQNANSMFVGIPSRVLARAFDNWCGHRAPNKKIPDFILCHQEEKILRSFLTGYETGDGSDHINKLRGNKVYKNNITTSRILAQQLQLAYARLGVWSSISVRKGTGTEIILGRTCSTHVRYCISYPLAPNPKRQKVHFLQDRILTPVRQITEGNYEGNVYNLGTSDNTYLVSNAIVHNCGRWFGTDIQLSMHQKIHYIV